MCEMRPRCKRGRERDDISIKIEPIYIDIEFALHLYLNDKLSTKFLNTISNDEIVLNRLLLILRLLLRMLNKKKKSCAQDTISFFND